MLSFEGNLFSQIVNFADKILREGSDVGDPGKY